MKKTILSCLLLLLLLSIRSTAQDVAFSQPYANPLYLNPAFAGSGTTQRIGLNYRNEWPGMPTNGVTYNLSYDRNFIDSNNGIGFLVNVEKSSFTGPYIEPNQALTTTNISLIYAHQFHIKSITLSAGVQATYLNLSIDQSKLVYPDWTCNHWWDWGEELLRTQILLPDFSAGLLGYWKNYFAGFTVAHPTQPNESFYQDPSIILQTKYTFNVGAMIHIHTVTLTPTLFFKNQGTFHEQIVEVTLAMRHIISGVGFSFQETPDYTMQMGSSNPLESISITVGYCGKLFRIGYSYYTDLSKLTLATAGTHEGSLTFLVPYSKTLRKKINGLTIPAF